MSSNRPFLLNPPAFLLPSDIHRNLYALLDESISSFPRGYSATADATRSGVKAEPRLASVQGSTSRNINTAHTEPDALPSRGMLAFQSDPPRLFPFILPRITSINSILRASPMHVHDLFPFKGPPQPCVADRQHVH